MQRHTRLKELEATVKSAKAASVKPYMKNTLKSSTNKLKELQKTIDEVEDAYVIIEDAYEIAYGAVVKAYDDYNEERNRQES